MEPRASLLRPSPADLPAFLSYASAQLQAPYRRSTYVNVAADKSKKAVKVRSTSAAPTTTASRTRAESPEEREASTSSGSAQARGAYSDSDEVLVSAVRDAASNLLELNFTRCPEIPRLLMQIVALCMPHQHYLTKLTVRWVPAFSGEALYEIAKFLPVSQITDICLDDSPVPEKNYHSLLDHELLKCLSLARCGLDDADCVALAAKLAHPLPASRSLCVLSLVSNAIADVGACALAEALRSNRTLQHLNLAGNRVTDVGACALFRSMAEFPLTYAELITKRRRLIAYLKLRKEVYLRYLNELTTAWQDRRQDDSSRGSKRGNARARRASIAAPSVGSGPCTSDAVVALRAETMANDLLGSFYDPFGLEETVSKNSFVYSLGNASLCYLNLAHNHLGYVSVSALRELLQQQAGAARRAGPGLLRVQLDGNDLPLACDDYPVIQDLLERAVSLKLSKPTKKSDKVKSKTKI